MRFRSFPNTSRKHCHFLVSALSFLLLLPLVLINFQLENPDDLLIRTYGSWLDAFMRYTPKDGRHIISFLNTGLFQLGFTYPMYQVFCSATFILSFIYLINSIISITKIDENLFKSLFFTASCILFPFMFDLYQWTSAYLIYSVGFACIAATFYCMPRQDGPVKFLVCGSLIALATCSYQPFIVLPFIVLALCAFFKDVPPKLTALSSQGILLVSSLFLYVVYNGILKRLWEVFSGPGDLQRTLSFQSIPSNFLRKLHTEVDIFLSHGAYHNLLYKPLSLLLFCIVAGLTITAFLKFDLKLVACALFLIIAIPTPIVLLEPEGTYWPSPRISFYINMLFPLGLLALLQKFPFNSAIRYGLCGILVLMCGNAFSILHHRLLQDRLDAQAAQSIFNQIELRTDRPLLVAIDPARIQYWAFNIYELGGTIFWAPYAITPYMNEKAKKPFNPAEVTFERDDGHICPVDKDPTNPAPEPPHVLCPLYDLNW